MNRRSFIQTISATLATLAIPLPAMGESSLGAAISESPIELSGCWRISFSGWQSVGDQLVGQWSAFPMGRRSGLAQVSKLIFSTQKETSDSLAKSHHDFMSKVSLYEQKLEKAIEEIQSKRFKQPHREDSPATIDELQSRWNSDWVSKTDYSIEIDHPIWGAQGIYWKQ